MKIIIIVFGFVLFDILSGFLKGLKAGKLNSSVLRSGLFHKSGEILAVFGAFFLEYAINYIDIGVTIPLLPTVSGYIAIMETISVIENICEVSPKLKKLFKPFLQKLNENEVTKNE
ncbi:MAG: phage holin family protein [bacterium]|nr:phage holin family protein [bacterium]